MFLLVISITANIFLATKLLNKELSVGAVKEVADVAKLQNDIVRLEAEKDQALQLAEERKNVMAKTVIDATEKTVKLKQEAKDIIKYITADGVELIPINKCKL